MLTISLEEAAKRLPELAQQAEAGEEIILTRQETPIAMLTPLPKTRPVRKPGSAKGVIVHIADDFDATPEGFEEYVR